MSEAVHNLPPENQADKKPKNWQNADDKDPRGIRQVWVTEERLDARKVEEAPQNDTAEFAKEAREGKKRLKTREVENVSVDARNFEYYNQKEEA